MKLIANLNIGSTSVASCPQAGEEFDCDEGVGLELIRTGAAKPAVESAEPVAASPAPPPQDAVEAPQENAVEAAAEEGPPDLLAQDAVAKPRARRKR